VACSRTNFTFTFTYWCSVEHNRLTTITTYALRCLAVFDSVKKIEQLQYLFRLFQITNLMHNPFILQQYVCYIRILNMFRVAPCSSSGGQILLLQPLVSSLSVNSRSVWRWIADCSPLSTCILYGCLQTVTIPEAVVIQFVLLRMSSVLLETC